jgi:DNA invertase Pin-like site-specific DNA recombinase
MLPGKKRIGRPSVTGSAELAALRGLIADGRSVTEAARILKIGRSTAYAALAATRDPARPQASVPRSPGSFLVPESAVRTGALIGYARVSTSGQLLQFWRGVAPEARACARCSQLG